MAATGWRWRCWRRAAAPRPPTPTTPLPDRNGGEAREFQLNIDGQQVSNEIGTGAQPRYSQDAIAEFQFLSNRFDATQGRTSRRAGQRRSRSRARTSCPDCSAATSANSDWFNAEDPVLHRVVPINNQQLSVAAGGPIVRDRLHYFGNFEYEREPRSSIWNTPYPVFNVELHGDRTVKVGGARVDYQLSLEHAADGQGRVGPALASRSARARRTTARRRPTPTAEHNNEGIGQLTQVLSNRAVNEVKRRLRRSSTSPTRT